MSEMIERVARAIHEKLVDKVWVRIGGGYTREDAMDVARAAIEAMREPTILMIIEGGDEPVSIGLLWPRLIDAALRPTP